MLKRQHLLNLSVDEILEEYLALPPDHRRAIISREEIDYAKEMVINIEVSLIKPATRSYAMPGTVTKMDKVPRILIEVKDIEERVFCDLLVVVRRWSTCPLLCRTVSHLRSRSI